MGDRSNPDSYFFARMRNKSERLRTYHDYPPSEHVTPNTLAAAGFFYTGNGDDTMCAFCKGVIGDWEEGDDPIEDHKKCIPNCKFVQGRDLGEDLDPSGHEGVCVADACQPRSQITPQSKSTTSTSWMSNTSYMQKAILDLEHTRMLVKIFGMEVVKKAIEVGLNKHRESFDSEVHLCDIILELQSASSVRNDTTSAPGSISQATSAPVPPPYGGPQQA